MIITLVITQVPSAILLSLTSEISRRCDHISLVYGVPAILSMLFSTLLMMVDFIVPCVTNKKVINLIIIFVVPAVLHFAHIR